MKADKKDGRGEDGTGEEADQTGHCSAEEGRSLHLRDGHEKIADQVLFLLDPNQYPAKSISRDSVTRFLECWFFYIK